MTRRGSQHLVRLACILGGIALSSLLVFVGLAASQASAESRPRLAALGPDEALCEPRRLLFQAVTVEGEIVRVLSHRAFALRSRSVRQGLLVVLSDQAMQREALLAVGRRVVVSGTVRLLGRQEGRALEREFGLDLNRDGLPIAYGNHPYVLALEVHLGGAHSSSWHR